MSLKLIPGALAGTAPLAAAKAWLTHASAGSKSLLHAVTKSQYRWPAGGAAVAVVILGLLLAFVPATPPRHHAGVSLAASGARQANSQSATPSQSGDPSQSGQSGQHHSSQPSGATTPGQVPVSASTSSPGPESWLYPTARPSPGSSQSSPSPTSSSQPGPPAPSPTPTLTNPGTPLPSISPSPQPPPTPSPSPSPSPTTS